LGVFLGVFLSVAGASLLRHTPALQRPENYGSSSSAALAAS
jgi:hypothetical protein